MQVENHLIFMEISCGSDSTKLVIKNHISVVQNSSP